jgi:hypothetical protein
MLKIHLQYERKPGLRLAVRDYDAQLENVSCIFMDVRELIQQNSELLVSGFGDSKWPVSVDWELPDLLDQLPDLFQAIRAGSIAQLDFGEQGVERLIEFIPNRENRMYVGTCYSLTRWKPDPVEEEISFDDLETMLLEVKDQFLQALTDVAADLNDHPWVRAWAKACAKPRLSLPL